jgi:hypothetical protein
MRGGRYLVVLAGVGVLAAGCGTKVAPPGGLAAAVTRTAGQAARIAVTTTQMQGMSVSFTETGAFGFACSRGMVSMQNPVEITEIFIPAKTYIKIPGGVTGPLPHGKSWLSASSLVTWARTSSSPDRATRVLRWPQRSQVQAISASLILPLHARQGAATPSASPSWPAPRSARSHSAPCS